MSAYAKETSENCLRLFTIGLTLDVHACIHICIYLKSDKTARPIHRHTQKQTDKETKTKKNQ